MLLKIRKMIIENEGYKRNIYFQNIYVNSRAIISITDYEGVQNFLLKENSELAKENFSLIKIDEGGTVQEVIAAGTAEKIYSDFRADNTGKGILNG